MRTPEGGMTIHVGLPYHCRVQASALHRSTPQFSFQATFLGLVTGVSSAAPPSHGVPEMAGAVPPHRPDLPRGTESGRREGRTTPTAELLCLRGVRAPPPRPSYAVLVPRCGHGSKDSGTAGPTPPFQTIAQDSALHQPRAVQRAGSSTTSAVVERACSPIPLTEMLFRRPLRPPYHRGVRPPAHNRIRGPRRSGRSAAP